MTRPPLPSQVERGAYLGKNFVSSDTHAKLFFDLCKQVGGPRLLPSKPRGSSTDDLSSKNNGPVASVSSQRSNEDVDKAEVDAANTEGQVCKACAKGEGSCGGGKQVWG